MTILGYLDPGTGSIILQTILGGVAAIGVAVRLYWSRIKSLFRRGEEPEEPVAASTRD